MSQFKYLTTPFALKNLELKNRLVMPPMCQFQATDGVPNDWHYVHYVSRAVGGAGLVIVEMTNVAPNGRISPRCLGLWNDVQRDAFKRIVDAVHAQGSKIAIQIAHAGRKAQDCVDAVAPSAIRHDNSDFPNQNLVTPHALSHAQVGEVVQAFQDSVRRAVQAGFDAIELHGAHGYLIHQFQAPKSNQRDDEYGQRRFLFGQQVIAAARAVMPAEMPLLMRLSAQEYGENGYDLAYGCEIARHYAAAGIDAFHVSGGGDGPLHPAHAPTMVPGYQVPLARAIKQATGLSVIAVGLLDDAALAEHVLGCGDADLIAIGRGLLRDPYWLLNAQYRQNTTDAAAIQFLPNSYRLGFR